VSTSPVHVRSDPAATALALQLQMRALRERAAYLPPLRARRRARVLGRVQHMARFLDLPMGEAEVAIRQTRDYADTHRSALRAKRSRRR
jgi:hypothetical protein